MVNELSCPYGCAKPATTCADKPTITVTWPNGGQNFVAGGTMTVNWVSTGLLNSGKDVQLSCGNWVEVVAGATNGTASFVIPADVHGEQCQVKVLGYYGNNTYYDLSDSPFTITQACATKTTIACEDDKIVKKNDCGDVISELSCPYGCAPPATGRPQDDPSTARGGQRDDRGQPHIVERGMDSTANGGGPSGGGPDASGARPEKLVHR